MFNKKIFFSAFVFCLVSFSAFNLSAFDVEVGYKTGISECNPGWTECSPDGEYLYKCLESSDNSKYDYVTEAIYCGGNFECKYVGVTPQCVERQQIDKSSIILYGFLGIIFILLICVVFILKFRKK